uniref:Uncharacterized protein n=1 Tax=Palpitomonas bilix TaxID=652834 RepID=A0A7S3CY82_9EUKA|mmetsp:Transcript_14583/g.37220  ORF Transcript_14583/g.37220 Transcript_14583/m.37220 type:complete len:160 (+) Transcript_14583:710-1189(+)
MQGATKGESQHCWRLWKLNSTALYVRMDVEHRQFLLWTVTEKRLVGLQICRPSCSALRVCLTSMIDRVIGAFSTYADLLSRIKRGYEDALEYVRTKSGGQPWASSSQEQPVSLGKQTDCDAEMAKLRTQCTDLETQLRKTQAMLKDKDDEVKLLRSCLQ